MAGSRYSFGSTVLPTLDEQRWSEETKKETNKTYFIWVSNEDESGAPVTRRTISTMDWKEDLMDPAEPHGTVTVRWKPPYGDEMKREAAGRSSWWKTDGPLSYFTDVGEPRDPRRTSDPTDELSHLHCRSHVSSFLLALVLVPSTFWTTLWISSRVSSLFELLKARRSKKKKKKKPRFCLFPEGDGGRWSPFSVSIVKASNDAPWIHPLFDTIQTVYSTSANR